MTSRRAPTAQHRHVRRLLVLLLVALVAWGPNTPTAWANHPTAYCDPYDGRSDLIELTTPDRETGLYIHDRPAPPGMCQPEPICGLDDQGQVWVFLENGLEAGLQTGGDALIFVMNETGSDDPCPEQPTSDDVVF